jgi:ABC-type Fe3+-siderophore transport system permease subunit
MSSKAENVVSSALRLPRQERAFLAGLALGVFGWHIQRHVNDQTRIQRDY